MLERYEQFSISVSSIYRSIQKIERVEMAKHGLKGPHAQCLLAMARFPEGIAAARLCEVCEKDKAAVSRTLAELEQAEMICRTEREGKRYRAKLKLTERGQTVARTVNKLVFLAVQKASEGYDAQSRETFINVLNLIAGNLQSICAEGLSVPNEGEMNDEG